MASLQAELGEYATTAVVATETDEDGQAHVMFEVGIQHE